MPNTQQPLSRLGRAGLYVTVFLTGAAVMVIELIGTRMIAPFYGASLYVWSSLIAVTMIALAIGYFAGGRWADRAKRSGLSLIIALAGVATLAIPWATRPVLLATDPLGLRLGAFTSALVLFSPSLMLLGMVGPSAVKLTTARLDGIGTGAGSIYAVSTVGSVVGTLLLGFFLFPHVGSREALAGTGVVLLALGLAVAFWEQRRLGRSRALLSAAVPCAIGLALLALVVGRGSAYQGTAFQIRSENESLYGWVRVIDDRAHDLRLLTSDASTIGAAGITRREGRLGYQDIVNLLPALAPGMSAARPPEGADDPAHGRPKPGRVQLPTTALRHGGGGEVRAADKPGGGDPVKRALLIGLGAGHMAMVLRNRHGVVTDTLEIDPAVADAAKDWFGFVPTGEAIVGDARYEMRRLRGPYDLIIHDCFTGGSEPAHLLTEETLAHLRSLLSPRGILAINFVAFAGGGRDPALSSVARTVGAVFPHYSVLIAEPGKEFNDFIFLASGVPIDLKSPALTPAQATWIERRMFRVDPTHGVVLTDNFNPLEHLQTRKAEHYRRFVADWLGPELLVR